MTPEDHARAERFEHWIRCDQDEHDSEQLELDLDTPARTRPHPGDPDGLESIGSIFQRVLADIFNRQAAA